MCHFSWEKIEMHEVPKYCGSAYTYQNTEYSYKKRKSPFDNPEAKEINLHETSWVILQLS